MIDVGMTLEQAKKRAAAIHAWIGENNRLDNEVPRWQWAKMGTELMELEAFIDRRKREAGR